MRYILIAALSTLAFSSWSQTNKYPKKAIIDGDTLCLINLNQLTKVNLEFVNSKYYKELSDTLSANCKRQSFVIDQEDQLINLKQSELITKNSIIGNLKGINLDYEKLNKKNERQIMWLHVQRNVLAVAVAATLIKIFVLR